MIDSRMPRRRFLLCLSVLPVLSGPRTATRPADAVAQPSARGPAVVVEYRGWIVHAEDRASLEARAGMHGGQASDPGALQ